VEKPLKHNAMMNFDIFVFEMTFDGTMNFELSLTCIWNYLHRTELKRIEKIKKEPCWSNDCD